MIEDIAFHDSTRWREASTGRAEEVVQEFFHSLDGASLPAAEFPVNSLIIF